MRKLFVMAMAAAFAIEASAVNLNNRKVANASTKTIDGMLSYGKTKLMGSHAYNDAALNAELFKQVGVDLSGDNASQAAEGKKVSKIAKLEKGDLIFFSDGKNKDIAVSGVVEQIVGDGSVDFIYVSNAEGVKVANTNAPEFRDNFLYGSHIANDKELQKAAKAYEKDKAALDKQVATVTKHQQALDKANKDIQKKQQDIEKAQANLEKAKQKVEAAQKTLNESKAKEATMREALEK